MNKQYSARDKNIIFYLVRYALPRNTSSVPDVIDYVKEHMEGLGNTDKAKLIIEIQRSIDEGNTNIHSCYSKQWLELIKELEK